MATKKQKRLAGELKAAEQRAQTRESGLKAQREDQVRREEQYQRALIGRGSRQKEVEVPAGARSKISQEKQDRVNKRLAEKEWQAANPSMGIDLKRDEIIVDTGLTPEQTLERFRA